MRYTLDSTVLIKSLVPPRRRKQDAILKEEQRLHNIARRILTEIEERKSSMCNPALAAVESAAVAARLTGEEATGRKAAEYVRQHSEIIYDIHLMDTAIETASKVKSSGFDTLFIACAKLMNSTLITNDRKMFNAAVEYGIKAKLLRDMK